MSTRSIIIITGKDYTGCYTTVRLYKGRDGYPTGNLPVILEAIVKAQEQDKENKERFPSDDPKCRVNVSQMMGLIIGASTNIYGCEASIDMDEGKRTTAGHQAYYQEPFKITMLGQQTDLEWVYIVDVSKKNVDVYGDDNSPADQYSKGVVHPDTEIESYKEECKVPTLQELQEIYIEFREVGWTINGTNLSTDNQPAKQEHFHKIVLEEA
jgi:hypothetical protein